MLAVRLCLALGAASSTALALHQHSHTHSAARHSLNFGNAPSRKLSASFLGSDSSAGLIDAFNRRASPFQTKSGLSIAEDFVGALHPKQEFRLQSFTQSNDASLVHAHFVQTVHGRDVLDALVNVNVDVNTGIVLSYGDSAFVPQTAETCAGTGGIIDSARQVVFGQKPVSGTDNCVATASSSVEASQAPIDPRLALVNFLLHADPAAAASFASAEELVESIIITPSLHADSQYELSLLNVPGAVAEHGVPAKLSYVQHVGELALVWSFELETTDNWYEAHVSAASDADHVAQPLLAVDWQRDAPSAPRPQSAKPAEPEYAYRVYEWGINDPSEGKRSLVKNPADRAASPFGWHQIPKGAGRSSGQKGALLDLKKDDGDDDDDLYSPGWSANLKDGAKFKDTRGNNVFAQDNPSGGTSFETNYRPKGEDNVFDFKLGWGKKDHREGKQVEPKTYINASVTELFYTCNEIHDLFYEYGFNEASGNFQEHNHGKGGLGGDAVVAMAQDGSGMNNANFATPPDGSRPRMRMYVWSGTPYTDGDLEAGIVIHEYMHGISTRLTGGPANSGCLGWGEAGGMGEGYGDFAATIIRMQSPKVRDYAMGSWAAHRDGGIRKYPYSTNMTVNPSTYKTLDGPGYFGVHAIGEVYAEIMFEVVESLIEKHGWTPSLFPPSSNDNTTASEDDGFFARSSKTGRSYPRHGNTYALQLLIDSFKLQPCRPSFFDNRDAVIQADHVYTGGENECLLWKAYAKRGLGPDANLRGGTPWGGGIRTNDFTIPKKCIGKH